MIFISINKFFQFRLCESTVTKVIDSRALNRINLVNWNDLEGNYFKLQALLVYLNFRIRPRIN